MSLYTPRPAVRAHLWCRLAIAGVAKAGKTMTALRFAGALEGRVCVIDAENGSAEEYLGLPGIPDFDIIPLDDDHLTPDDYVAAIQAARGYDVLVIDTISPEWIATLEIKDAATLDSPSQNAYTVGWKKATPLHNKFMRAMLAYQGHLIVTIRQRKTYTQEKDPHTGKLVPVDAGLKNVQRTGSEGVEFFFSILCELNRSHTMTVSARCPEIDGKTYRQPDASFMEPVKAWLGLGVKVYTRQEILDAVEAAGKTPDDLKVQMAVMAPRAASYAQLTVQQKADLYQFFTALVTSPNTPDLTLAETPANGQPT